MTTTDRVQLPVPAHALPQASPRRLLDMAHTGLEDAVTMGDGLRYTTAHLAALRAAAAVLAARAIHVPGAGRKVTSVWVLLPQVAEELTDWAAYFAQGVSKRAAAEAGISRTVTAYEADALVRSAADFVGVVETMLGVTR